MDISLKINELLKSKNLTVNGLANKTGISFTGLRSALKVNDFKISTLENIASALDVPIQYFFDVKNETANDCKQIEIQHKHLTEKYKLLILFLESFTKDARNDLMVKSKLDSETKHLLKVIMALCDFDLTQETKEALKKIISE